VPVVAPRTALVLSGGGARGAYAVGVLSGMSSILGGLRSRFQLFTGTSVGALHAAQLAAHADREDLGLAELVQRYSELRLRTHLRPHVPAWLGGRGGRRWRGHTDDARPHKWALLDARPFERIVRDGIPWARLHDHIRDGLVHGLLVSGLRVSDGKTVTFAELSPGAEFVAGHDPRRDAIVGPVSADHVLASSALPLLFPSRRIGDSYYCDGGLRFNTPMAPAIRAGADRLVVVALRAGRFAAANRMKHYPKPFFLLGKILDALLLDPVEYDLHVLDRLNRVIEVLERTMAREAFEHVRSTIENERGLPYRQIPSLVFHPSADIGVLAGDYMRSEQPERREGLLARTLLRHAAALGSHVEADFVSYLLFDGGFARLLIELGQRDALARASEIRAFFGVSTQTDTPEGPPLPGGSFNGRSVLGGPDVAPRGLSIASTLSATRASGRSR
jgi:NTE family protein